MKSVYVLSLALALLLVPTSAAAQSRQRRTPSRRPPATTTRRTTPAATAAAALRDGRAKVAEKIKTISNFLYLYGRFSKDYEASAAAARNSSGTQPDAAALNRLRASFQDIAEGLQLLELQIRSTPELERYYPRLQGVAKTTSDAEAKVASGQLDQAGRDLLAVVSRLTDALAEMN
ncbi:MAG: hypothetical protein ACRD9R_18980 [Pyrinomonadaceae bacterium]